MKLTLLAIGVAALAAGYAATGHAGQNAKVALPKCPSHAPKFNSTVGSSGQFVRPNARGIRLCRYYKNNWATGQTLWHQRTIREHATVKGLTRAFDKLQEPPRGIFCVRDDGSEMLVIFGGYGSGLTNDTPSNLPERVVVKLSGCRFASNGKATRSTTAWLHKRLLTLVDGK